MLKVSTLIGEVVDGIPVPRFKFGDETFYTITVNFRSCNIHVVLSEFTKEDEYVGKVKVTGYVATFKLGEPGQKASYVFVGNKVESVDIDTETTNEIEFAYKVTRIGEMKVNSYGVEVLSLYVASYTPFKTTSVIRMCAKGQAARLLSNRGKDFYIKGTGYLKNFKEGHEIIVQNVEIDDEGSDDAEEF